MKVRRRHPALPGSTNPNIEDRRLSGMGKFGFVSTPIQPRVSARTKLMEEVLANRARGANRSENLLKTVKFLTRKKKKPNAQ